jgi:hypothetical protein
MQEQLPRAQSFTLLTAPAALLTIQSFSLCPRVTCMDVLMSQTQEA